MSESATHASSFAHRELDFGGPLATLEWSGGDGTPLLLIHGADGSAANWVDIAPLLPADRRVVAVDLPGFGRSPVAGRKPSMEAYGRLICELIERELGGRAAIAGNSMGAVVAVLAASRAGEAVAATSLVAPAVPRAGSLPVDPTMVPMLAPFLVPGLAGLEARRRHGLPPERRVRQLLDMCYAPGGRESDEAFAEMIDVARNRERSDQVQGWSKAFRSLLWWLVRRGAWDREARQIRGPVQIIEGAADPIIPSRSITGAIERHPSWSLERLEGVGHVPQLEAPKRTAEALEKLLAEVD
ncbi:MAG: alpha/beta fold hydrolase [Solirubrobacterales bacterium]